jgi:hypothetical protein
VRSALGRAAAPDGLVLRRWVVVRTRGGYVMALTERERETHASEVAKVLWQGRATDYRTAVDAYNNR